MLCTQLNYTPKARRQPTQPENHTPTTRSRPKERKKTKNLHGLQGPRSRHASVVLRLGRPVRRPPPRREPPQSSQPRRRRLLRLRLLQLPPPRRGRRRRRRRGLVDALDRAVPRPAAAHQEAAEPGAAPGGWPRRRRGPAPERALADGADLPEAGHLGRPRLGDGGLGLAPAAAGPGLLGEDGGRVAAAPRTAALAQLPAREADDGGGRGLEVPREPLRRRRRGVVGPGEEALGVGVPLERVVPVVDAVDVGPGDVVADAELGGLRRVVAEVARGGHGWR
jgi:hypothetical protein